MRLPSFFKNPFNNNPNKAFWGIYFVFFSSCSKSLSIERENGYTCLETEREIEMRAWNKENASIFPLKSYSALASDFI
jgi:hypothetical protein